MRALSILALLAAVTLCWMGSGHATNEIGSPVAYAPQAGFAGGFGYHYHKSQWEYEGGDLDGDELPGGVTQSSFYARGSYGFLPHWEVYVRVGAADAGLEEALSAEDGFDEAVDFDGGYRLFYGGGLRGSILRTESFRVGPFLQYNRYSTSEDDLEGSIADTPVTVPVEFSDAYDLSVGVGVDYQTVSVGRLYGGVFTYWAKASGRFEIPENVQEYDFQEKGVVGGFLGLRLPLGSGILVNFEGVYKSDISASVSIGKAFGMK